MSAFAGLVYFDGRPVAAELGSRISSGLHVEAAADPVIRRVPSGVFVHRQRVVTPEDRRDHQPSISLNGLIVSVFDGRLDNRGDLASVLNVSPETPDGALVRLAYEKWGGEAPARLLGDFAWTVWDVEKRQLLLARDHSIHRALFYHLGDGFVAFATTYTALFGLPEVPRELDEGAVCDLLLTCCSPEPGSLYKGINWVRPAERVVLSEKGAHRSRFWDPTDIEVRAYKDEECVEAAREVFERAVRARTRLAGPTVIWLSGGLDSSAVAATVASLRTGPVHGLTMVPSAGTVGAAPDGWYLDETPFVEELARMHPSLQVECLSSLEPEEIETDPQRIFAISGVPLRGAGNIAWFMRSYRRARQLGATAILTGGWGNITLSMDGLSHLAELSTEGRWLAAAHEYAALRGSLTHARWKALGRTVLKSSLPTLVDAVQRVRGSRPDRWRTAAAINPAFADEVHAASRWARDGILNIDPSGAGGHRRVMRYFLSHTRIEMESQMAMRAVTGLDLWDPFADRRVLEFMFSLPTNQLLRNGQTRWLARRAFADRLPASIVRNRLRGRQNGDWLARLNRRRAEVEAEVERLEGSRLASRILDLPLLKAEFAKLPDDATLGHLRAGMGAKLMRDLNVGQFLKWYERANT